MYERTSINELALKTVEAVQEFGLTIHSAWNEYCVAYLPVVKLHEKRGKEYFDRNIEAEYSRFVEGRRERGEISVVYYRFLIRLTVMHFPCYHEILKERPVLLPTTLPFLSSYYHEFFPHKARCYSIFSAIRDNKFFVITAAIMNS